MPDREEQFEAEAKRVGDGARHTLEAAFPEYEISIVIKRKLRRQAKLTPVTSNPTRPQVMRDGQD